MSKWDERVHSHPVNTSLTSVHTAIEQLSEARSAQGAEDIQRLLWIVNHITARLKETPAIAVPGVTLDQINQYLTQVANEVNAYNGNGNIGHLANANTHADSIIDASRSLSQLTARKHLEVTKQEVQDVRNLVSQVLSHSEANLKSLTDEVTATSGELEAARTSFAEQSSNIEQRIIQNEARLSERISLLDQTSLTQQNEFTKAQERRDALYQDSEASREKQVKESLDLNVKEFKQITTEHKAQASTILNDLEVLQKQAEQLVGAIGVTGVASGYNETATQQRSAANKWRIATVSVAMLAAAVLSSALFIDRGRSDSWQLLTTRLVVSLSFAGLAAYCGRQSAEHRREERNARARQIQLAALNPYLADMPAEESVKLKTQLALGYFTASPDITDNTDLNKDHPDDASPLSIDQLIQVIKMLATKGGA